MLACGCSVKKATVSTWADAIAAGARYAVYRSGIEHVPGTSGTSRSMAIRFWAFGAVGCEASRAVIFDYVRRGRVSIPPSIIHSRKYYLMLT